jgi:chromosome segregation ATPase
LNLRQAERKKTESDRESARAIRERDDAVHVQKQQATRVAELEKELADSKKALELSEWRLSEQRNDARTVRKQVSTLEATLAHSTHQNKKLQAELEESHADYEKAMQIVSELSSQLISLQLSADEKSRDAEAAIRKLQSEHEAREDAADTVFLTQDLAHQVRTFCCLTVCSARTSCLVF